MIRGLLAVAALSIACHAQGALMITAEEVGGNVVFTGAGSLDLSGLTRNSGGTADARVWPAFDSLYVGDPGPGFVPVDAYNGPITSPSSFGVGGRTSFSSGSGDRIGVTSPASAVGVAIIVPDGYAGGHLYGISTFSGTFSDLGINPGTYVWSWAIPDTPNRETLTLQIGPAAVSEPSTLAVFALGGIGIVAGGIRRRRKQNS